MQHTKTLIRMLAMGAVFGIATLALPLAAHAGVRVSVGLGLPVVVAPLPPAVVYPAPPAVVTPPPVVYGGPQVIVGGYYGYHYRPWRHHYYRWHRW